jgi:hypothetical protein
MVAIKAIVALSAGVFSARADAPANLASESGRAADTEMVTGPSAQTVSVSDMPYQIVGSCGMFGCSARSLSGLNGYTSSKTADGVYCADDQNSGNVCVCGGNAVTNGDMTKYRKCVCPTGLKVDSATKKCVCEDSSKTLVPVARDGTNYTAAYCK